jgi:hypothetical protein
VLPPALDAPRYVQPDLSDPTTRWWTVRRAQNRMSATCRCPLCNGHLPALSEHMLITPEGVRHGGGTLIRSVAIGDRRDRRLAVGEVEHGAHREVAEDVVRVELLELRRRGRCDRP